MKKLFLCFLLLPVLFLSCKQEADFNTIDKIDFYTAWELGDPYRTLIGSTDDPDFILKNAWFYMAICTDNQLENININITTDTNLMFNENIIIADYEVMRRRYNAFGYYLIKFDLEDFIGSSFNYDLKLNGKTKSGKKYAYKYKGKADLTRY